MLSLPSIPPDVLSDWGQPGALVAIIGLLLAIFRGLRSELRDMRTDFKEELKASETRQELQLRDMRTDFKQELKASEARQEQQLRASESRQEKQMDELKEEIRGLRTDFKQELRASETRQQEQISEIRESNKLLGEKVDRLIEVFLSAQVKVRATSTP